MPNLFLAATFLLAIAQVTTTTQPASAPPAPAAPTAKVADVPTPGDAKLRMEMASKANGLGGLNFPWHLKATYEVLTIDGASQEKGTYEEWHGTGKKYRVAYHSPATSLEDYESEEGVFRVGAEGPPREPVNGIRKMIAEPVYPLGDPAKYALQNYEHKFGPQKLQCTAIIREGYKGSAEDAESFCFAPTNAVLLYASSSNKMYQRLYQHVSVVNGQFISYDVQRFVGGRLWLKLHIESLDSLKASEMTALSVPAGARNVTPRNTPPGKVIAGRLLKKVAPTYPAGAKLQGIQGLVLVSGVISKTGHLTQATVLAGPSALRQAALDAVQQWVYEPYLLNGEPVEVETMLNVVFNLGH